MIRCRPSRPEGALAALAGLMVILSGCGPDGDAADSGQHPDAAVIAPDAGVAGPDLSGDLPYATLSPYGFFTGELSALQPATGVVPYDVVSPLWSDGTEKHRFLYLPPGEQVQSDGEGGYRFPVGTVVIKDFALAGKHLETRLIIRTESKWTAHTYLWNADQSEAERKVAGVRLQVPDGSGGERTYLVPNTNQCANCHERDDVLGLLGVTADQLDRDDQLQALADAHALPEPPADAQSTPLVDPYGDAPLERRARSWLHANCAHCHRPGGNGGPSGLELGIDQQSPTRLGVCKGPVAAGSASGELTVDIDPGHPERSILVHRLKSSDPEVKMPEIPNLVPDPRGVKLIEDWIAAMPEQSCE